MFGCIPKSWLHRKRILLNHEHQSSQTALCLGLHQNREGVVLEGVLVGGAYHQMNNEHIAVVFCVESRLDVTCGWCLISLPHTQYDLLKPCQRRCLVG